MALKIKIQEIVYHRNGVGGNGFHVIKFRDFTQGRSNAERDFLAVLFDEPGNIAVFNSALLAQGNITSGENSWRAEDFEDELRGLLAHRDDPNYATFFEKDAQ